MSNLRDFQDGKNIYHFTWTEPSLNPSSMQTNNCADSLQEAIVKFLWESSRMGFKPMQGNLKVCYCGTLENLFKDNKL